MKMARIPDVERGMIADVEPGALVYSTTRAQGNGFVGGIVYEVVEVDKQTGELLDDPIVRVVRWDYHPTSPYLYDLHASDIDAEMMTFFTTACDKESQIFDRFFAGLKTKKQRDEAAHWRPIAAGLAAMASTGAYTLKAQQRYEAAFAAKREARVDADPVSEDRAVALAAELTPKMEEAINTARARREER